MTVLWVVLAGGLGAVARYDLAGFVQARTASPRPWGTLAVNVTGSLLLGVVVATDVASPWPSGLLTIVTVGFLGGFTTFSTWMVETAWLAGEGGRSGISAALVNLAAMMGGGLAAAGIVSLVAG